MRPIFTTLLAVYLVLGCGLNATAQNIGTERILVPYPAGGPSDATARTFANAISDAGSPFIVENLGGATGLLAVNKFLANPAGLVFQGSQNELVLPIFINPAAKFKSEDFLPVQYVTKTHLVLITRKSLGVKTLDDFFALAKKREADPLTYGSVGVGSLYHVVGEYLARTKQIKFNHIPYKGGAPVMQDLLGGQIDFTINPYQPAMDSMRDKGLLNIIAVFSKDAPDTLIGVDVVSNYKGLEKFEFASLAGYFLKSNASEADKSKYQSLFSKAVASDKVKSALSADGRSVLPPMSVKAAGDMYRAEITKYTKMLNELKDIKFN